MAPEISGNNSLNDIADASAFADDVSDGIVSGDLKKRVDEEMKIVENRTSLARSIVWRTFIESGINRYSIDDDGRKFLNYFRTIKSGLLPKGSDQVRHRAIESLTLGTLRQEVLRGIATAKDDKFELAKWFHAQYIILEAQSLEAQGA